MERSLHELLVFTALSCMQESLGLICHFAQFLQLFGLEKHIYSLYRL